MKTPVLEPLFNKVTGSQACNFVKKRFQHRCFPVKFGKFIEDLRCLLLLILTGSHQPEDFLRIHSTIEFSW